MRPLLRALATIPAGALALTLAATPAHAVPTTTLNPAKLPRGADVSIPHLEGKTVVDGAVRIPVKGKSVRLLGKSGTSYVVATARRNGSGGRVLRYDAGGVPTELARANIYATELSGDGQTIVSSKVASGGRTTVTARSASTGAVVATHVFKGYVNVLDAQDSEIIVGAFGPAGTQLWDTATDTVTVVTKRVGYRADLSLDRLATFTKDPYLGGCTVLSSISKPGQRLWESCTDAVTSFSTDGSRLATVDILTDGIGPNAVTARTLTGRPVGSYKVARRGWFGEITWESPTALLLQTNGPHKAATVRCDRTECELATDVTATVQPRVG
jgi:hypothetical protein